MTWNATPQVWVTPVGVVMLRIARRDELVPLRHAVLRTGLPLFDAHFPADELPATLHLGAFDAKGEVICCGTYVDQAFTSVTPGLTGETAQVAARKFEVSEIEGAPAYRLRGMATDADYRGTGVGRALLELGETILVSQARTRLLWCDARLPAIPFYEKQGWRVVSDRYLVPTAGPHHRMVKRLSEGSHPL